MTRKSTDFDNPTRTADSAALGHRDETNRPHPSPRSWLAAGQAPPGAPRERTLADVTEILFVEFETLPLLSIIDAVRHAKREFDITHRTPDLDLIEQRARHNLDVARGKVVPPREDRADGASS